MKYPLGSYTVLCGEEFMHNNLPEMVVGVSTQENHPPSLNNIADLNSRHAGPWVAKCRLMHNLPPGICHWLPVSFAFRDCGPCGRHPVCKIGESPLFVWIRNINIWTYLFVCKLCHSRMLLQMMSCIFHFMWFCIRAMTLEHNIRKQRRNGFGIWFSLYQLPCISAHHALCPCENTICCWADMNCFVDGAET